MGNFINNTVSIIMPVYNVDEYIASSIESVQKQTYENWELIVINDGSRDNTLAVANDIAKNDERIIVVNQQNAGVSRARNKGLVMANGQYVAFLDGDDLWKPDYLTKLLTAKGNAEVVYCGYRRLHADGHYGQYKFSYHNGWLLPEFIQNYALLHISSFIVDRAILTEKNIWFTEECSIGEDSEFIVKILVTANVRSVQENLTIYRLRPGSVTHTSWDWQKLVDGMKAIKRATDYILAELKHDDAKITCIMPVLYKYLTYKTIKFLWKMIKLGHHEAALSLINSEFADNLQQIKKSTLSSSDYLRYLAIISKNKKLWGYITTFYKNKK